MKQQNFSSLECLRCWWSSRDVRGMKREIFRILKCLSERKRWNFASDFLYAFHTEFHIATILKLFLSLSLSSRSTGFILSISFIFFLAAEKACERHGGRRGRNTKADNKRLLPHFYSLYGFVCQRTRERVREQEWKKVISEQNIIVLYTHHL
jgi:hypothetical protein